MNAFTAELLPPLGALVASYFTVIWRSGWRWVLGVAAVGAVVGWLLMQWSFHLNGLSWLGGLVPAISAMAIGVGVASGAVVQVIDALRPDGRSLTFRGWGFAVVIGGIATFLIATG